MKKKSSLLLFIVACLIICIIPFAGTAFFPSDELVGNEEPIEFPSFITEEGKFNQDVFEQMGTYFERHFTFRPYVISLDAEIQSNLFKVSNLESVIVGKDDFLFYSSTLDNHLGKNLFSKRAVDNIAHNLQLTQSYVNSQGAEFLFTVAPNKNSLYEQYMPYYYGYKASDDKNIDALEIALEEKGVNYSDLYSVFENTDEVLYLKEDSHWNDKGAKLAYEKLLTDLSKDHKAFSDTELTYDFDGDLAKMLYPKTQKPEKNFDYTDQFSFNYTNDVKSVEDPIIQTQSDGTSGNLYMYRDSFSNSLLPFMASTFEKAYFTKTFPVNLSLDMLVQKSDTVVFEIVERNLDWFLTMPPVIPSSQLTYYTIADKMDNDVEIEGKISQVNMTYMEISGELPDSMQNEDCEIFLELTDSVGEKRLYETFHTSTDNSDYGYLAYIPIENYDLSKDVEVSVVIKSDSQFNQIGSSSITVEEREI